MTPQTAPPPLVPHPSRLGWVRRALLGVLVLLVALAGTGFTYQTIARERDEDRYPPPGQLVDAGRFTLHLNVMGEPHDGPTVLLEHGGGSLSSQWGWIHPAVSERARVVAYDRPGLGWSEASPEPLDATGAAAALKTALTTLGIEGPYVVVGHSMGGLMARAFARLYPDEVVGLVLIDPRPVSWDAVFPDGGGEVNETFFRAVGVAARLGVVRLLGLAEDAAAGLPERQFDEAVALTSTRHHFEGSIQDGRLGESAIDLLAEDESLGDLPLVVLSAELPDDGFDETARPRFNATHQAMADLSSRGEHRVVAGADHVTIVTHEAHARQVTQAVRDVLVLAAGH